LLDHAVVVAPYIVGRWSLLPTPSTVRTVDSMIERRHGSARESAMTNLSLFLTESADMYPGAAALRCEGATRTYSELADQAARFAAYLAEHDVQPGDRVAIMLGNRPEFAAAFYGVLHAGGVVVPLDPLRIAREVELALTDSGARILFFSPSCSPAATAAAQAAGTSRIELNCDTVDDLTEDFAGRPRPVSRAGEDNAVILYTFGEIGAPKGAQLTHGNLVTTQAVIARSVLDLGPEDVVLGCLPLFHAFSLTCGLMATVGAGSTFDLLPNFDQRRALEAVAAEHVTVVEAAPTMYTAMLEASDCRGLDFSSLRVCISGGSAMPGDTRRRYEERFGCIVLEGYGLSDSAPAACFNQPGKPRKVGSVGTPIKGVQVRVVDEGGKEVPVGTTGKLQVRGHNVIKGYWKQPEATAAAIVEGWLCSGDTGFVDEDGYFYIVDRTEISSPGAS
jgi:long-chain acyl-CoA synthetase